MKRSSNNISELLLSSEEMNAKYVELSKNKYQFPYTYQLKNKNRLLIYIGFQHSNNPNDPQFQVLDQLWNQFIQETKDSKKLVIIEGGLLPKSDNKSEAISKYGEPGYVQFISNKLKIKTISPEPSEKSELKFLEKTYPHSAIIYYYFARLVNHWQNLNNPPEINSYIKKYLNHYKEISNYSDITFSLEYMISVHDKLHPNHTFDILKCQCFYDDSNPYSNPVADSSSSFRDINILEEIFNEWNKEQSIFIVYGSGHAIKQENAIKTFLI